MKDLLEALDKIAELLYQEEVNAAYGLLVKCLPIISAYINEVEEEEFRNQISATLKEAMNAMEINDYTLLADIIQYDLMEMLKASDEK